jgi:hypothetical protein
MDSESSLLSKFRSALGCLRLHLWKLCHDLIAKLEDHGWSRGTGGALRGQVPLWSRIPHENQLKDTFTAEVLAQVHNEFGRSIGFFLVSLRIQC